MNSKQTNFPVFRGQTIFCLSKIKPFLKLYFSVSDIFLFKNYVSQYVQIIFQIYNSKKETIWKYKSKLLIIIGLGLTICIPSSQKKKYAVKCFENCD